MTVLAFDISSGGVSAAVFDSQLKAVNIFESHWELSMGHSGAATLSIDGVVDRVKEVIRGLDIPSRLEAVVIGCFMHNCLLLDAGDRPITPVFTWLDRRGEGGMEYVRSRIGDRFHEMTGCRYHPMFPIFKLAALQLSDSASILKTRRVASVKSFLTNRFTGVWMEDHGMASASGLYNVHAADWDASLLDLVGLKTDNLPPIRDRVEIVGRVTRQAAAEFGLPEGALVVNGAGDGFLANVGSDCETPESIAVTLGTSASARQTLHEPVLDPLAGTFCYQADRASYLFGCAGNNGGNVLDWARSVFGELPAQPAGRNPPIFIPLLNGERSPEWNPHLRGSWHGLTAKHTAADLAHSVLEGVLFNLALYVEILQRASCQKATRIVLSGNGFLQPFSASILAGVVEAETSLPQIPGQASLRGAAVCAWRALGAETPPLDSHPVEPQDDAEVMNRFQKYKELRSAVTSGNFQTL